jgi:hypothetical protein
MKLVKSLLLSSAVGISAIASAQAADLPFRKAAPVEYVRVCDYTGAGYFYIPGTDTCLKVGGYLRAEYGFLEPQRFLDPRVGNIVIGRRRDASGFKAEGRIDADARTQTAYGTLRTYVRFQMDRLGGNNAALFGGGNATTAYLDKGFIQFAGFTAGRAQSNFDFYADNYNFESIANSDQSVNMFAYTATFGGGFSATIAAEDPTGTRRDGIGNTTNIFGTTNVAYAGLQLPDFVANVRVDQAWGAAQLSAAYHQVRTLNNFVGGLAPETHADADGFAVQGGVQFKLPMLAAGDQLWLEGAYQEGAFLYQDAVGSMNAGFTGSYALGGLIHPDADAVAIFNSATGTYTLSKSKGYSVMGAFQHYFTPTFSDILFGSYEHVSYGAAKNIDWALGGIGDASEYRIGNQFVWTPVNNLSIGLEVIYSHIDQTLAHAPGVAATALPVGIKKDPSAFEARLRMERDF